MTARLRFQLFFVIAALACAFGAVSAQSPAPQAPAAAAQTIPLEAPVPFDPSITKGTLPNGLRYFIRTTKKPEKRAELRLVVDVGSIVEEDDQQGLAHLLEHMAFNGTKHFPKQETVAFLESLGMRFGPSINAYTSFDETVYMLQVPTDKPEVMDRAFLILEDWAHGQTLDATEIDKERGVVKEEWRLRRGAGARMQDKQFPVMLKGSRYADRLPIGKPEIIDSFKHDRLRAFYTDWYRPDLMTVIAAGDFDAAAVEKMIKAHFSQIPAVKAPKPRPNHLVPNQPGTRYTFATDPEATSASITIYSLHDLTDPTTVGSYRQRLVERLFGSMLSLRFSELAQKPDSPIVGAGSGRGLFVKTKGMTSLGAGVKGNAIEPAIDVLFTETERVRRFGFTPGELDRMKQNILTGLERSLTEKENATAASIANELVRHVTNRETVPGITYEVALNRRFLPTITLAEVNALAKNWLPEENRIVAISAPEKAGFVMPDEARVAKLMAADAGKDIAPYVDTVDDSPLLDAAPKPGAVVKTSTKEPYGITEWELSNGVTVVLKPTTFRADEILFRATSAGGASLAPDADYFTASGAAVILGNGGLGKFSMNDLRKKLTGKTASASASIGDYEEGLSGSGSKKDLETMFQLIYLRFTQPRVDAQAFAAMQGQMKSMVANQRSAPGFHYQDALNKALYGDHVRRQSLSPEQIESMNLEKAAAFYRDRFADASDFTFVFVGSFDLDTMKPLVEQYLGGLPSTGRKESWKDVGIRYATGTIDRRVEKGIEPQSQTSIVFSGPFEHNQEQRIAIRALADVLGTRLHEKLREDVGGTYGVSASASYSPIPVSEYSLRINFGSAPDRVEGLVKAAYDEIELLKREGPSEKQVSDVQAKLLRDYETNMKSNSYLATQLLFKYQYKDDVGTLFAMDQFYKRLTPAAIQAAAKLYLNPANVVKVSLFPEKK